VNLDFYGTAWVVLMLYASMTFFDALARELHHARR